MLPALGSREALFAFTQTVIDPSAGAVVVCPNPFYQIYEGATLLAGGTPYYVNADAARNFGCDWNQVPEDIWRKTRLVFVCSPGNPAGNVMSLEEWKTLFQLSDRHGFVIASDECYSEIYRTKAIRRWADCRPRAAWAATTTATGGVLQPVQALQRARPALGLRGRDAALIGRFLLYRTYHGSAMSPIVTAGSIAAWTDEEHVKENRRMYREKFDAVLPILRDVLNVDRPQASFYLWAGTSGPDTAFVRDLYGRTGVTVLPGSFLARDAHGVNPGENRVRGAGRAAGRMRAGRRAHRAFRQDFRLTNPSLKS